MLAYILLLHLCSKKFLFFLCSFEFLSLIRLSSSPKRILFQNCVHLCACLYYGLIAVCNQVEYQLSDTNLVASDFLMKIMNKDPEGYGMWSTCLSVIIILVVLIRPFALSSVFFATIEFSLNLNKIISPIFFQQFLCLSLHLGRK